MVKILEDEENNILDGVVPELDQDGAPVEPIGDPAPEEPQNAGEPEGEFIDVMAIIQQLAQDCIVFQSILNDLEKEINELFANNGQGEENLDLEVENADGDDDPVQLLAILYNEVLEFYQAHPDLPNPFLIEDAPSNDNNEVFNLEGENMGAENMEDNNLGDDEWDNIPMEECGSNIGFESEEDINLMDVKQGGEKLMDKKLFDEILEGKIENEIMTQNQDGNATDDDGGNGKEEDDDISSLSSDISAISMDGNLVDDVFLTISDEVADDQIE
ncbi:hypothetical protein R5R35_007345 [Gryllus longicercus]|uniref:Uncharacterized protein n=1 Tax=Gryllus longicercus TaxID=2509291 RepID=A0AAN9V0W9_9ORTH